MAKIGRLTGQTGRLSGQTGRLSGQTGRLSGQTPKNNMAVSKNAKLYNSITKDYECLYSFRQLPTSDAQLERIAAKLIEWAKLEDSRVIGRFLEENDIGTKTWANWVKRSPLLQEAYAHAKMCIGNHREDGALTKKYDAATVVQSMPIYNEDWMELQEWRAKLKESKQEASVFNINVPDFSAQFKEASLKELKEQKLLEEKEDDAGE